MAFDRWRFDTKLVLKQQNLDISRFLVQQPNNTFIFQAYKNIKDLGILAWDYVVVDRWMTVGLGERWIASYEGKLYMIKLDGRNCNIEGKIIGRFRSYNT